MNKAEAMFRAFFEDDAEYVLFCLAHKVQIETQASRGPRRTCRSALPRCCEVPASP
jgi:hypothetical protein